MLWQKLACTICTGLLLGQATNVRAGSFLGDLSWPEAQVQLNEATVIIPVGAGAKEHGQHLPLNTDSIVLDHLLQSAVQVEGILIAPAILHGWFPSFRDYPGTEIADPTVFQNYVEAVSMSLIRHGAKRLVFLNTGISRATGLPLAIVARDLRADHGVHTLVVSWDDLETDQTAHLYQQARGGHADEGETSIMLYLRPDLVDMSVAKADLRGPPKAQIGYAPGKFERADEDGVYGDPTLATRAKGKAILAVMRANLDQALAQFQRASGPGDH
jgi:creatinine amidohydrolase